MTIQTELSLPTEKKDALKIYRSPELIEYGKVRELTKSAGPNGMGDGSGGGSSMNMTSV